MSVLPCQIGDGIRIVIIGLEKWIEQDKQRGSNEQYRALLHTSHREID